MYRILLVEFVKNSSLHGPCEFQQECEIYWAQGVRDCGILGKIKQENSKTSEILAPTSKTYSPIFSIIPNHRLERMAARSVVVAGR